MLQGINTTDFLGSNMAQRLSRHRKTLPRLIAAKERTGDPAKDSRVTYFIAERKVTVLGNAGARRRVKNADMSPSTERVAVRASATSAGVRTTLSITTVACARVLELRRAGC